MSVASWLPSGALHSALAVLCFGASLVGCAEDAPEQTAQPEPPPAPDAAVDAGPRSTPTLLVADNVTERFGTTLLAPGDITGNGFDDLVVGVPDAPSDACLTGCGELRIYEGAADGVNPEPIAVEEQDGAGLPA